MSDTTTLKQQRLQRIDERRGRLNIARAELSRQIGYEHPNGWTNAMSTQYVSMTKLERAETVLDHYEETGEFPDTEYGEQYESGEQFDVESSVHRKQRLDALEGKRKQQGVAKTNLSMVSGWETEAGWETAVRRNCISDEKLVRAAIALHYHEQHGILPLPEETELPTGPDTDLLGELHE